VKKSISIVIGLVLLLFFPPFTRANIFKDSLGRTVNVVAVPQRVVSLAPNITEMLYFLELEERLVGVTTFSSFPVEARKKPKVGVYTNITVEKVIALKPDLVIATADGNERGDVEMLEQAGIAVYVINPRKVFQVLATLERVGVVCGAAERAEKKVRQLRQRVGRVVETVSGRGRPLVFLVINAKPLMSVNRNTTHHDLIELAGGRNMAEDQPITYPRISIEEVIGRGPEVILISSMERGGEYERAREEWSRWGTIPAVEKGRVHLIDSDLIDRAAPRVVRGLEQMARLIHPRAEWYERR